MPSHLRSNLDSQSSTHSYYTQPISSSPAKKQRMSLTQTYYIASTARTKLGREASRADHNLRFLVGHANLLDTLMVELQDAEREQEAWFNESIKTTKPEPASRHIQWIDAIAEELEEDSSDDEEESDEEDSFYDEDFDVVPSAPTPTFTVSSIEVDEDDDEDDYDYDDEELALTRVESHTPELVHGDSDSEDESLPPSPSQSQTEFEQIQHTSPIKSTPYLDKIDNQENSTQQGFLADNVVISQRQAPMISVY